MPQQPGSKTGLAFITAGMLLVAAGTLLVTLPYSPHRVDAASDDPAPRLVLSAGSVRPGDLGQLITYTHQLTNTGSLTDVVMLWAANERRWPVALGFLGEVPPPPSGPVSCTLQTGESVSLELAVQVPNRPDLRGGEVRTIVTATSALSPALAITATDTTVIPWRVHLPLVRSDAPPLAKLGVDFGHMMRYADVLEYDLPLAREMEARWIRLWLPWGDIERQPGVYDWSEPDAQLGRALEVGFDALVVVYGAPTWASRLPCGPIDDLAAFERFIRMAVERYPWVKAWEFVNEPDGKVPHQWGPIIGCWGPYPCEYADALRRFESQVRAANPKALVFFGGLAYDWWEHFDRQFFTHTLQCGAGQYFDGLSLHYYPINSIEFPKSSDKIGEVQATMRRHGVFGKLIWITEIAMWTSYGASLEMQKDFIVREQTRALCSGVDNLFWFAVRQEPTDHVLWRWLISREHRPGQGYFTYQHFARQVQGGYCAGRAAVGGPEVEAYRFRKDGGDTYVLWSNGAEATVYLPASEGALVTDRDGTVSRWVEAQGGTVGVGVTRLPVFVRVGPMAGGQVLGRWAAAPRAARSRASRAKAGEALRPAKRGLGRSRPAPRAAAQMAPQTSARGASAIVLPPAATSTTLDVRLFVPTALAGDWLAGPPAFGDEFNEPGEPDRGRWRVFGGQPKVADGWLLLNGADLQSRETYRYGLLRWRTQSAAWPPVEAATDSHFGFEVWTGINGTCHQGAYFQANGRLMVLRAPMEPTGICLGPAEVAERPLPGWEDLVSSKQLSLRLFAPAARGSLWAPALPSTGARDGSIAFELAWSPERVRLSAYGSSHAAAATYEGPLVPDAPLKIRLLAQPGQAYRFDWLRWYREP